MLQKILTREYKVVSVKKKKKASEFFGSAFEAKQKLRRRRVNNKWAKGIIKIRV